jgi:hypothetical protein
MEMDMMFRRVPVQRLETRSHRMPGARDGATSANQAGLTLHEEWTSVPEFHVRGLLAVIPTSEVSPLALRLSDLPSHWRESDAA